MHGPWHPNCGRGMWGARPRGQGDAWAGMWNEWWRGPAPRAERGIVRWLVLDAIARQPRHGYEVIQVIGERSGGGYRPSPGVVYPTLQMLEELGHVQTAVHNERKVYEITAGGRRELAVHADDVRDFYDSQSDARWEPHAEDVTHVMLRVGRVVRLFKRAMHRGGLRPPTIRKARAVLDDALEKLESLLAPEEP